MNTTLIGILFMGTFLAIVLIYKAKSDKAQKAAFAKRKLDILANPQNYFISEGGLIPDPIPTPEETTVVES